MNHKRELQLYLMSSYLYYIRNIAVIPDDEYDALAKTLLDNWDDIEHQHKHLVSKGDLQAGTLYHLTAEQYPKMVIGGADLLLKQYERTQRELGR